MLESIATILKWSASGAIGGAGVGFSLTCPNAGNFGFTSSISDFANSEYCHRSWGQIGAAVGGVIGLSMGLCIGIYNITYVNTAPPIPPPPVTIRAYPRRFFPLPEGKEARPTNTSYLVRMRR